MIRNISLLAGFSLMMGAVTAFGHGDTVPQSVNTAGLPELPEELGTENPWREADDTVLNKAVEIGAKGFNSNCARCHGLEAISGGLAPDLRFLEANDFGDEWYLDRVLNGYEQNGAVKMPPFEGILTPEAIWAIRTYVETRPDDQEMAAAVDTVREMRDKLQAAEGDPEAAKAMAAELTEAGAAFDAPSGAPKTVTVLDQAAYMVSQDPPLITAAIDVLNSALRD